MEIITITTSEAHEAAVDTVLNTYKAIEIQTHPDKAEKTIEFEDNDGSDDILVIKVIEPLKQPQASSGAMFKQGFIDAYKKQFLALTPPRADGNQATYTYWNRLEDHPTVDSIGDGFGNGLKQISELIQKLADDPNSRRAVAVTWNPYLDFDSTEPPCMNWVQFVIRNGKVNMRCVFRSQDILSGLGENLIGCAALLEYVRNGINEKSGYPYDVGSLILISTIPHIYHYRDAHELLHMKMEINKKKMFGTWNPIIKR
jgi:thymidylate synthase